MEYFWFCFHSWFDVELIIQQEAGAYLFGGKEMWPFPLKQQQKKQRKAVNQQKKAGNHHQHNPFPTLKLVSTEGVGYGVLENIKKFDNEHYYITEVTNDDMSYGVLYKTYTK